MGPIGDGLHRRPVRRGRKMADAMSASENYFPQLVRDLVHIGEVSGNTRITSVRAGRPLRPLAGAQANLSARHHLADDSAWLGLAGRRLVYPHHGAHPGQQATHPICQGSVWSGIGGFIKYVAFLVIVGFGLAFLIGGWRRGKLALRC